MAVIQLHATRKLFAKLPVDEQGLLPPTRSTQWMFEGKAPDKNPLDNWHGNLLTIQRRPCILLVHDETRFPVFLPCMAKPDIAELNNRFLDAFMNTLLKCGADDRALEHAQRWIAALRIDTVCNRSVQGTLNRMAFEAEHMLAADAVEITEITGYRVGACLAHGPCGVKGRGTVWPDRAMLATLSADTE